MRRSRIFLYAGVLALLIAAPLLTGAGATGALVNALIAALFALAFNLLVGQGGMMSFGHAAYFAFGTFATLHAMIAIEAGNFWFPTPLLPLIGGLCGLIVGAFAAYFATLRSGVYFAMVTLAVAELFHLLAPNLAGIFGGEVGISSFRMPFGPFNLGSDLQVYYLVLIWVAISAVLMFVYTRTPFGRLTLALRENEQRVAFMGYNVHRTKIVIFAISAMFSGIAGGLFAVSNESANYVLFGMNYSANVVLHTVIGGSGVFLGPALGAILMSLGGFFASDTTHIWLLYQGIAFVLVVMFLPQGIGGLIANLYERRKEGTLAMLVRPTLIAAGPALLMLFGALVVLEALGKSFSRDYAAKLATSGGIWPTIPLFGLDVSPASPLTWLVPAIIFAVGVYLFRRALRVFADLEDKA